MKNAAYRICTVVTFLLFVAGAAQALPFNEAATVVQAQAMFDATIGKYERAATISEKEKALLLKSAEAMIAHAPADLLSASQFFVYADRNPKNQLVAILFFSAHEKTITLIGADRTSTGNPKRRKFFETPTGYFANTPEHFSYRALGTKNDKGWRGLGAKGSRVWDFGWQQTDDKHNGLRYICLLMHATDPHFGEPRLGKPDSQGCVRISAPLNAFLDQFGILDKEYEKPHVKNAAYVLKRDRTPAPFAGKYLVVGDSRTLP